MIAVVVPAEDHIIGPRAQKSQDNSQKRDIRVIVRILPRLLRGPGSNEQSCQYPQRHRDPIDRHRIGKDVKIPDHMAQMDSEIRKLDRHWLTLLTHFSDIEPEQDHIAVLDHVLFSLQADNSLLPGCP